LSNTIVIWREIQGTNGVSDAAIVLAKPTNKALALQQIATAVMFMQIPAS
jgi:hypothetical protein